jgi:hypothetical protein
MTLSTKGVVIWVLLTTEVVIGVEVISPRSKQNIILNYLTSHKMRLIIDYYPEAK